MITFTHNAPPSTLPDAVLFDFDNTLYAYDPAHDAAWNALVNKVATILSISHQEAAHSLKIAREEIKKTLEGTAGSHSRLLYAQRALEMLGLGTQASLALDLEQTYWRTFLDHAKLFDGVKDCLDNLRLLGVPIALVTDLTTQIQLRKLVFFGLDNIFDCIVTSEESGADKPHPASFLLAIKKLQPKGSNIWMIGDNSGTDIIGAREAIGAITFQKLHDGVTPGHGNQEAGAHFHHFTQLSTWMNKLALQP